MAELIKMQNGRPGRVGPGSHVSDGSADAPTERGTFGANWPTEKHCKTQDFGG